MNQIDPNLAVMFIEKRKFMFVQKEVDHPWGGVVRKSIWKKLSQCLKVFFSGITNRNATIIVVQHH